MSFPKDWEIESINRVTKVGAGGTPSTLNLTYWENGSIPWMSSGELHQKQILDVVGRITELGLKNSNARILPRYCVLIGLAGQGKTRGTVAINMVELSTNQSVAAIYPSPKIDPFYLYHNMDSRYQELRKLSTGEGGRGGLNLQIIGDFLIPLPPLEEQKRIAALLGAQDRQIEALSAFIALRQRQFRGLVQALISTPAKTGRWNMVELGEIMIESRTPAIHNDPKKRLSVKLHLKGVERREYRGTEALDSTVYFSRKKGQFIYGKQNIFRGALGIIPNDLDNYESTQDLPTFDISPNVNTQWFYYFFSRKIFYTNLESLASGTGSKRVHPVDLYKIPIPLPSAEEQERIASILGAAQRLIACLERKRELCLRRKKGLMQVLLTGKVRV